MATVAQLNAEIGVNIQPLQQGLAAAESAIQGFGQDVAASANVATESLSELYQGLDNLQKAQARLPESSPYFDELSVSISEVTAKIDALESAEAQLPNINKQVAATTVQAAAAMKEMGTAELQTSNITKALGESLGGLRTGFSFIRQLAYILPGIGIAGIFSLIEKGVVALGEALFSTNQKFGLVQDDLNKAIGNDLAQSEVLEHVAQNTALAYDTRYNAAKKLIDQYPEYLKKGDEERIMYGQISGSLQELNKALIAKATIEAAQKEIGTLGADRLKALQELTKAQEDFNKVAAIPFAQRTRGFNLGFSQQAVDQAKADVKSVEDKMNEMFKLIDQNADAASKLFNTTKASNAKTDIEKVSDALKKLQSDLTAIKENGALTGESLIKIDEEQIRAITATIKRLIELGPKENSPEIQTLTVKVAELKLDIQRFAPLPAVLPRSGEGLLNQPNLAGQEAVVAAERLTQDLEKQQLKYHEERLKAQAKDDAAYLKDQAKFYGALGGEIKNVFEGVFTTLATTGKLSFQSLAQSMEKLLANLAATAAEAAVLSLILSTITGGANIAASLGAQGTGFLSLFKAIIPHAEGGVFAGPTLIGNHIFAEKGPEALVPLNGNLGKLQGNSTGFKDGQIVSRIDGNDIVLVFNRQGRYNQRNYGNFTR